MEKSASQWLGAAAIGGGLFVAYRMMNRGEGAVRRMITPVEPALSGDTAEDMEPGPPVTEDQGDDTGTEIPETPTTNPQWGRMATDRLVEMGWNAQIASTVIGKYLQRLALSAADADIIRSALGQVGNPPENGPWPITIATPAPTPQPPPVVNKPPPVVPKPPPPKPKTWKYTWVRRSETGRLDAIAKKYAHAPKGSREVSETFKLIANKNGFVGWKGSTVMRRRTIYVPAWKLV